MRIKGAVSPDLSAEADSFGFYDLVASPRQLNDQTLIQGIPWSELKQMLRDPNFDKKAFTDSLTDEEAELLLKLSQ